MVFRKETKLKGAPSQRQLKVGEEIRHILSDYVRRGDFYNVELQGLDVTITEVRISPDMGYATVFVYPLGGKEVDKTVNLMNTYKKSFRYHLGQNLKVRVTPELVFRADNSFEEAKKINDLLHLPEVVRDLHKKDDEG